MWIRRQIRRIGRLLLLLLAIAAVAAVTLPYWIEPAVRPLARRHGVTWSGFRRDGWRRIEVEGLRVARGDTRVNAASIRVTLPGRQRPPAPDTAIEVRNWEVTAATRAGATEPTTPRPDDPLAVAGSAWNRLARYLPSMRLTDGVIELPDEPLTVTLPDVTWQAGSVSGTLIHEPPDANGRISVAFSAGLRWPEQGWTVITATLDGPMEAARLPYPSTVPAVFTSGRMHVHAMWNRGPLQFTIEHALAAELEDGFAVAARAAFEGGAEGIRCPTFDLAANGERILQASGRLPVIITPGAPPGHRLKWDADAPLRLEAETEPGAELWDALGREIPAWPVNPVLTADIAGTRAEPSGRIRFRADRIDYAADGLEERGLPSVSAVALDLVFSEATALLERLAFQVAGQDVALTARLPLGEAAWRDFIMERRLPHWSRIEGTLEIPGAEVAAFRSWFPDSIAPAGRFSAELAFRPGGMLHGRVRLRDAATRPVMPVGVMSSINGDLVFDGRTLNVERLSGRLGERDVTVTGRATLTDDLAVRYRLHVAGESVPLVRRPGLLLRGDLDVSIHGATGPTPFTRLGGSVNLKSGYFLSELRLPVPGSSLKTPEQRPPYFSVEVEPFADWELDLRIRGHEFMQVRSPVFTGVLSADFRLGGTLREPVTPGAVEIDRGTMRFPFGTLAVERGRGMLTPDNPFVIEIDLVCSGRIFGYDVTMTLSGTDTEPVLEFTSTPPLGSDVILLMITAGQLPEREIEFTGQQRAARLALFLGQNLLYELTGDEHVGERLMIDSGRNISRSGRETYAIRYRLNDRLSVTGEYDEYDAINAGIRLRLFSR